MMNRLAISGAYFALAVTINAVWAGDNPTQAETDAAPTHPATIESESVPGQKPEIFMAGAVDCFYEWNTDLPCCQKTSPPGR